MCPLKTKIKTDEASVDESMEIIRLPRNLHLRGQSGEHWLKVITLENLFEVMQQFVSSRKRYRLVAGNTGMGVCKAIIFFNFCVNRKYKFLHFLTDLCCVFVL